MAKLIPVLILLFLPGIAIAQVSFHANLDAKQVVEGGTFTVTFTLENADAEGFEAPNFSPFKVISGPSQSYRSRTINGRSTKSASYSYMLQAGKPGKYKIRAAKVRIKGKELSSKELSLVVLKSDQVAKTGKPDIFIRTEVDSNQVYIGQQVIIRYKIYTQVNIENYNIITESSYGGCFAQALDTYKEPVIKEVIEGKQYSTKVLRKVAVFPQQGGKIEIEPLVVQIGIPSSSTVRRGFLSSFGLERRTLNSNRVDLYASSPHEHAPEDFSGAVGNFNVAFSVRPNQVTTDDAISIVLRITGNGDVKTIRTPSIDLPPDFQSFDPKVKNERMINASDSVRGEKVIEYLVIGQKPGRYTLKPSFTYFNPGTEKFVKIVDSFALNITQGTGALSTLGDHNMALTEDEIAPIIHDLSLQKVRKPIYLRPWYAAAYVLPVLAFLFLSWRSKTKVEHEIAIDPQAVAKERLEQSKKYMDAGDHKLFYEEVAYSLKQFISSRLKIATSDLSKDKISSSLMEHGVDQELVESTRAMLDRCDMAIYAGLKDIRAIEETYQEAVNLLTGLDETIS